ncbi:hypothetical protein HBA55_08705 [Pseudomaricurvus alkylphenolicus]|jgi:hypothetical protein|uniref:DUF6316 family protein n=1 Tax=Pseudomaricurvus alkylphenolicus TaxID=1306991 RepID=UPI00141FD284|nr:DUF6316 family protein [Pseudomaricurvus alkylphenolicus]NIB39663.1 hypothetical protein [Pseudomaricurvus alkylphenolicus]
MTTRSGEQGAPPTRSERFFESDGYWYYTTREGVDIGPFDRLEDAQVGCSDFVDFISSTDPNFPKTLEQYAA